MALRKQTDALQPTAAFFFFHYLFSRDTKAGMDAQPPADGIAPREYPLTIWRMITHLVWAALFLAMAAFFLRQSVNPYGGDFSLVIGSALMMPFLLFIVLAFRSRLILQGDRIEVRYALHTYTATRNEIEGQRTFQNRYGRWTRIYFKDGRDSFNISRSFTGDNELNQWLNGLLDLDQREASEITQELAREEPLGSTKDEVSAKLNQARSWAIGLSIAAGLAFFFSIIDFAPVHTAAITSLVLSLPLAAFLLYRFPLLFTIGKRKPDPRSDLSVLIFFPAVGVAMSYQTGSDPTHLVDATQLFGWFAGVSLCCLALLFPVAWKNPSRWGLLFLLLTTCGLYGIGLVNIVNTMPDRSAPVVYHSEVVKKYITRGRHTTAYLRLAPWGPIDSFGSISVSGHIYRQTQVGDQVCLGLHSGFLHAPWFTLIPCS